MTEETDTITTDMPSADSVDKNSDESADTKVPVNLRPHVFKPGQSGNPGGRPKGLTATLSKLVDVEELSAGLVAMARDTRQPALRLEAIKYIWARIEGSPVQAMRFQTDSQMVPLIFLHPGKEAPVIEAVSKDVTDTKLLESSETDD